MITDYNGIVNLDEHIGYVPEFSVGDVVWDDLTGTEAIVTRVLLRAYELDNDHLEGMRFAWEVSNTKDLHR
jgi:hypothetical protein